MNYWCALPSLISSIRIPLGFLVYRAIIASYSTSYIVTIMTVAFLSDALDGYLARRLSAVTRIGILFDPLCDKIFLLCVYSALIQFAARLSWWCLLLASAKELSILISVAAFCIAGYPSELFQSNRIGKTAFVIHAACCFGVIVVPRRYTDVITLINLIAGLIPLAQRARQWLRLSR